MFRPPSDKLARKALLVLALAGAAACWSPVGLGVDVAVHGAKGGHALLRLGLATIRIAFDFGQECSKSNGCDGPIR